MKGTKRLVVLEYALEKDHTNILTFKQASNKYRHYHFSVDVNKKKWCFMGIKGLDEKNINQSRYIDSSARWGIIGVYDPVNIRNLNLMTNHAQLAIQSNFH